MAEAVEYEQTLRPNADGTCEWIATGSPHCAQVNDDSDATYIRSPNEVLIEEYGLTDGLLANLEGGFDRIVVRFKVHKSPGDPEPSGIWVRVKVKGEWSAYVGESFDETTYTWHEVTFYVYNCERGDAASLEVGFKSQMRPGVGGVHISEVKVKIQASQLLAADAKLAAQII